MAPRPARRLSTSAESRTRRSATRLVRVGGRRERERRELHLDDHPPACRPCPARLDEEEGLREGEAGRHLKPGEELDDLLLQAGQGGFLVAQLRLFARRRLLAGRGRVIRLLEVGQDLQEPPRFVGRREARGEPEGRTERLEPALGGLEPLARRVQPHALLHEPLPSLLGRAGPSLGFHESGGVLELRLPGHLLEAEPQVREPPPLLQRLGARRRLFFARPELVLAAMADPARPRDPSVEGQGGREDRQRQDERVVDPSPLQERSGDERDEESRGHDEGPRPPDEDLSLARRDRGPGPGIGDATVQLHPGELERLPVLLGGGDEIPLRGRKPVQPAQVLGEPLAPELFPLRFERFLGGGGRARRLDGTVEERPEGASRLGRQVGEPAGPAAPLAVLQGRGPPLGLEGASGGLERLGPRAASAPEGIERAEGFGREDLRLPLEPLRFLLELEPPPSLGPPPLHLGGEAPALAFDDGHLGERRGPPRCGPLGRQRREPLGGLRGGLARPREPDRFGSLLLDPPARPDDLGFDGDLGTGRRLRHPGAGRVEEAERPDDARLAAARVGDPGQLDGQGRVEGVAVEDVLPDVGRRPEERLGQPRQLLADGVAPPGPEEVHRPVLSPVPIDDPKRPGVEVPLDRVPARPAEPVEPTVTSRRSRLGAPLRGLRASRDRPPAALPFGRP